MTICRYAGDVNCAQGEVLPCFYRYDTEVPLILGGWRMSRSSVPYRNEAAYDGAKAGRTGVWMCSFFGVSRPDPRRLHPRRNRGAAGLPG